METWILLAVYYLAMLVTTLWLLKIEDGDVTAGQVIFSMLFCWLLPVYFTCVCFGKLWSSWNYIKDKKVF